MKSKKTVPGMFILLVAAMLLLGAVAIFVVGQANLSRSRIPIIGTIGGFELTAAHNGELIGPEQLKGMLTVYDFIFTNCQGPCPVMSVNMSDLYELYKGSGKVRFVSISVDPERDSLSVLNDYAKKLGVNTEEWIFLRGDIEEVSEICEKQFLLPAEDLPGGHTTRFILVDHLGRIRSYHDGLSESSMDVLKNNIRQLAREIP